MRRLAVRGPGWALDHFERSVVVVALVVLSVVCQVRVIYGLLRAAQSVALGRPLEFDAVLVLGGDPSREEFAAKLFVESPRMTFISSGSFAREDAVFDDMREYVHVDRAAVDTVTNFSSMIPVLDRHRVRSVLVITSSSHKRRASAVGTLMLGSRGLRSSFLSSDSSSGQRRDADPEHAAGAVNQEPLVKCVRDVIRALVWIALGLDGARVSTLVKSFRSANVPGAP